MAWCKISNILPAGFKGEKEIFGHFACPRDFNTLFDHCCAGLLHRSIEQDIATSCARLTQFSRAGFRLLQD